MPHVDLTRLDPYLSPGLVAAVGLFCATAGWYWPVPGMIRLCACAGVGLCAGWVIGRGGR